jgi:pimeloyl-ACP methyl ester carboxylesterase
MERSVTSYTKINGHPTWVVDQGGAGEPLLLLHGGLSNSDILLDSIGSGLRNEFHTVAYDRRGHGRTADTDADFHYRDMATEAIQVLQEVVGGPAHLVGWSDGGIIGLLVALERPDLVRKLVVIGTNYHYDGNFPMEPDPQSPLVQVISTAYSERSPDGADHLYVFLGKSFAMFASEPTLTSTEVRAIALPTLVMVGDDDVVKLSHTCSLYEALPEGQLAIVPGASHALPVEKSEVVSALIVDFLSATDPPRTLFPIRRAGCTDT